MNFLTVLTLKVSFRLESRALGAESLSSINILTLHIYKTESFLGYLQENFLKRVQDNAYPGRGVMMGQSDSGEVIQLYWIMGRSANSRNRVFEAEGNVLRTKAADPSAMKDPSLVIYEAMLEHGDHYIMSNGDQTRTIYQSLQHGADGFEKGLICRDREPDGPNYTPRITGMVTLTRGVPFYRFAILKANEADPSLSDRNFFYREKIKSGQGLLLTTYEQDGSPLPSFSGEPVAMPLSGSPETMLETYWDALDVDNKISLAIKVISPKDGSSRLLLKNRN